MYLLFIIVKYNVQTVTLSQECRGLFAGLLSCHQPLQRKSNQRQANEKTSNRPDQEKVL